MMPSKPNDHLNQNNSCWSEMPSANSKDDQCPKTSAKQYDTVSKPPDSRGDQCPKTSAKQYGTVSKPPDSKDDQCPKTSAKQYREYDTVFKPLDSKDDQSPKTSAKQYGTVSKPPDSRGDQCPESVDRRASHLPFWTPGSGHFGDTLGRLDRDIVDSATDLVLKFIDAGPVEAGRTFTLADLGTNDGYSSMNLITNVIGHVRQMRGEAVPIQVVYEDQEKNDFNSLFARLSDGSSFMSKFSNVYPLATNVNFYKQCLPDNFCDVIFSSIAVTWLEDSSVLFFKDATYEGSPRTQEQELRHFRDCAAQDWAKFLLLRARELKPGGLLVVLDLGMADGFLPNTGKGEKKATNGTDTRDSDPISCLGYASYDIQQDLEDVWKQMQADGVITQDEYERCTLGSACRTVADLLAPFRDVDSHVTRAGLTPVHCDLVLHPCPFKTAWKKKLLTEGVDDREEFAQQLTVAHRVYSQSSYESSLCSSRSRAERAEVIEQMYARFQRTVAGKDPDTYRSEYIVSRVVIKKL